jgi:hypothetical protein
VETVVPEFRDDMTDDVLYRVTGKKTIKDHECFEIEEVQPPDSLGGGYQERKLLYFRIDTGAPIRVTRIVSGPGNTENRLDEDFPVDPEAPSAPLGAENYLFPIWSKDNVELQLDREKPKAYSQAIARNADQSVYVFRKEHLEDDTRHIDRVITQKWKPGEPWWREMTIQKNGNVWYKAALLPDTIGSRVNAPKANRPGDK